MVRPTRVGAQLNLLWNSILRESSPPSAKTRRPALRLETLEDRTTPAVHEWTGLGNDNLWSNDANWTNNSPATDNSGDIDLVFHTNLTNAANLVMQNDISNLVVDSITFDANAGTGAAGGEATTGYTVNGNAITIDVSAAGQDPNGILLSDGIAAAGSGLTETFNLGLVLLNIDATFRNDDPDALLSIPGDIDLGTQTLTVSASGFTFVTIAGDISNGNLGKDGAGSLRLTGDNSYTNLTVDNGVLLAESDTSLGSTTGAITVNDPGKIQLLNGITVVKTQLQLNSNVVGGGLGTNGNTTNTFRGDVVLNAGVGGVALGAGDGSANAATRLVIDGVISGATSTLFINGAGTVEFVRNNTYTGQTNINIVQGATTLQIDAPGGLGATGDANRTIISRDGAGPAGGTVLINFSGTLAEDIDFAGAGVNSLGAIRTTASAIATLSGGITFIAGAPWTFNVDGASSSLTTTGVIDSQGANRALTKIGAGALVIGGIADNTYRGTIINAGTVVVTNSSTAPLGLNTSTATVNDTGTLRVEAGVVVPNPVQINTGGTLAGNGIVTGDIASTGGAVSPGASTGILTAGNVTLDAASKFQVEINGIAPGSGYDQLQTTGAVNLAGASLDITLGFTPVVGNAFAIIDAAAPVTGTFAGLAEGALVTLGGNVKAQITYVGGAGGNDVILTVVQIVQFASAGQTVARNAGAFQIDVPLSVPAAAGLTVPFTVGGTAVNGIDFANLTASPLTIATGQSSAQITGVVKNLGVYAGAFEKTLTFDLGAPSSGSLGTPASHTITITPVTTPGEFPSLSAAQSFIQDLYVAELGREGNAAELNAWQAVMDANGTAAVAAGIHQSLEARFHQVDNLYQLFLGRSADAGAQAWAIALAAGVSEEQVMAGILSSPEFFARSQTLIGAGTPNERFVQALYQTLLHRQAGASDLAAWVGALPTIGRAGVASAILGSVEFRASVVQSCYNQLLHRTAAASELQGWVVSGIDLGTIRRLFEQSVEFLFG